MGFLQGSVAALAGLVLVACVAAAEPPVSLAVAAVPEAAPFLCRVEAVARAGRTEVRASVTARAAVSGLFWLDLARTGAGGAAAVAQSGPFSVAAGETLTLGMASFAGVPSEMRARMVVTWAGGEVRCPVAAPMRRP